jgi:hypothetical protein
MEFLCLLNLGLGDIRDAVYPTSGEFIPRHVSQTKIFANQEKYIS